MTKVTGTKPNAELAYKVLDHIDANPQSWNQAVWVTECGTAACFAGWTVLLSGEKALDPGTAITATGERRDISKRAAQLLGFLNRSAMDDASWEALKHTDWDGSFSLFAGANSREDLGHIVEAVFGPRPGGEA